MSITTVINVIGIGYRLLDAGTSALILGADVIIASRRLSEVFNGYMGFDTVRDRVQVINNVDEAINFIKFKIQNPKSKVKSVVFLASGDPLFFGIGRRMVNEFGEDKVAIFPDLSCIQVAFSRIKEPWDNALLMSIHGGPDPANRRVLKYEIDHIPSLLEKHDKLCILTDRINNPTVIAKELLKHSAFRIPHSALKMYVCEKLGYSDEKVIEGTPEDISSMAFSDPNVVIIKKIPQPSALSPQFPVFGLGESEIAHSRGLITKDEIRAVTIHKLKLPEKGVFWDIGAGSGSVSIEAARLFPDLRIFAVEKNPEQLAHLQENKIRFCVRNIEVVPGEAPMALNSLPLPQRVFIGGSNDKLAGILKFISGNTGLGVIVINASTIETLNEAIRLLEKNGFRIDVSAMSVSRSKMVAGKRHLSALNPVFIVRGERN
ncbi:MAG: precorrin-6y C5,15-methyltransferase (decarboxylating) subunit CbiE [Nitrospirota bacterium]